MDNLSISRRRRRFCLHLQSEVGEEDYLSNLPDELLHHILSFLPTLDSIRTSVLARRWRHVWTSVPVIDFSYLQTKSSIIDRFVASRGGDSVSRLHFNGLAVDRENVVYKLVEYAKSHDAQHVTLLYVFFEHCRLSPFDLLFDWPSLVSLNLQVVRCQNRTFSECIFRLSNLKILFLQLLLENPIDNQSLAKLLSGCPVLEELELNAKYPWDNELIQIEAPNLLRLTLIHTPTNLQINCQKLEYLRLNPDFSFIYLHVEAPSLTSVRLYNIWRFNKFAHTVCNVSAVAITLSDKFSDSILKFLRAYEAVVRWFPIFHNLLELKIEMHVAEKLSLDIVLKLLRCTPNLQSLVLTAYKKGRWCVYFDEWGKSSSSKINKPLEHLERVSVNIKGRRIRSAFLKTLSERVPKWDRVAVSY